MKWPDLRAAAQRHPRVVDGLVTLVVGVFCAAPVQEGGRGRTDTVGVLDWTCLGLLLLPLVWRRRAPVLVFWTVFALAWFTDLVGADMPAMLIIPLVAVHAVARHRPLRFVWPAAGAIQGSMLLTWALGGAQLDRLPGVVGLTGLLAASVLLGINTRTRRAYLAELEERARRLTRERDQQAQLAAAAERARIAREMHDIVAHNLAVMIALADGAAYTATANAERAAGIMRNVSSTGRQALGEMRRLLGLLRDDGVHGGALNPQPGLDDIDVLVDQLRAAGLRIALTREGVPDGWSAGVGLAAYRIVQEALTNTLKHAGPEARAEVRLTCRDGGVDLEITDDGARRPPASRAESGHGLAGMAERAASYGGRLEAGPRPIGGWRVHTQLTEVAR